MRPVGAVGCDCTAGGADASSCSERRDHSVDAILVVTLAFVGERFRSWASSLRRQVPVSRSAWIGATGIAGAIFLARWLDRSQPLRTWFFFDLATILAWQICLSAACTGAGYTVVKRLLSVDRTPLETLALSFPVGVVIFVLGMYAGGYLHLFGPAFAVALPAAMILSSARPVIRAWRARASDPAASNAGIGGLSTVAIVVGVLAVGIIYLGAMSPDAVNYDASWNHLAIAQDYAREGRIVSFPADWNRNFPHLGSVLNTWAFLVPGLRLPALRWMMALHDELSVFVWTLVGIAAAARWLAGRQVRATWVAFILFPGLFVCDSNLGGSADHFVALFAAPLLLLTGKAFARIDRGVGLLWSVIAAGALMSKVQGAYIVVPAAAVLLMSAACVGLRRPRGEDASPTPKDLARTLGLMALGTIAVLFPHLAGNLVFYHNPFYPLLQNLITSSTPTYKDAAVHVSYELITWQCRAMEPFVARLMAAAGIVASFSFVPGCSFTGGLPVFGSTFTLSLAFLPFIRQAGRLWLGAAVAAGALLTWAMTYRADRNLQTFTPALIAVTAALLVRAWDTGRLARIGVALLVVVQVAWSLPLYFEGSGRMMGAMNLLKGGVTGASEEQLKSYRSEYVALGKSLPKDAKVVIHSGHPSLGIDRTVLLDAIGFEGLIDYRQLKTPREMYDYLKRLGVTHVVWTPGSSQPHSTQEEVLFDVLASLYAQTRFSELSLLAIAQPPPPVEPDYRVVTIGVRGYGDGLYPIGALIACQELPAEMWRSPQPALTAPNLVTLIDQVPVVVTADQDQLDPPVKQSLDRDFQRIPSYHEVRVFLRLKR